MTVIFGTCPKNDGHFLYSDAMRRGFGAFLLLSGIAGWLLGGCASAPEAPPVEFWAGTAVVDITPIRNVPLGGYGGRKGAPMAGVHDSIHAKALWMETPTSRVCLVTTDLI